MDDVARAPMVQSGWRAWSLLGLVLFAQTSVAGYSSGDQIAWLAWTALALLAAGVASTCNLLRSERWADHLPYLLIAGALVLWLALVQWRSIGPQNTLSGAWRWWCALLLVPIARDCWRRGLGGWLLAVLVIPVVLRDFGRGFLALGDPGGNLSAGLDPNVMADRIGILVLLGVALGVWLHERVHNGFLDRVALPLLLILVAVAAMLVQQALGARAVMGMLVVGLVILAVASRQPRWSWLPVTVLVVYALPLVGPDWLTFSQYQTPVSLERFGAEPIDGAFAARLDLLRGAWELLPAGLLTGTGIGSFELLYPAVRGATDRTFGVLVHNDFLQLLLEGGLVFFLALIAFTLACVVAWSRLGVQLLLRPATAPVSSAFTAFAALTVAGWILAHALINFPLYNAGLLNLLVVSGVLGLSYAWHISPRLPEQVAVASTSESASRAVQVVGAGVLLVLVVFWVNLATYAFTMVTLLDRSPFVGVDRVTLSPQAHFDVAKRLRALGVGYGVPAYMQAHWASQVWREHGESAPRELPEIAILGYAEAIERSPWQAEHYIDYARFLEEVEAASFEQRLAILEEARRRNPFSAPVWLAIAEQSVNADAWTDDVAAESAVAWLPTCYVASYLTRIEAEAMFALLPESALALEPELAESCRDILSRPPPRQVRRG